MKTLLIIYFTLLSILFAGNCLAQQGHQFEINKKGSEQTWNGEKWVNKERHPLQLPPLFQVEDKDNQDKKQILSAEKIRFIDNRDGTVIDTVDKLMWQKEDDGQMRTFAEAQDYCRNLRLCGFSDWRLPDKDQPSSEELIVILMTNKRSQGRADFYWSDNNSNMIPFNYPVTHVALSNLILTKEAVERGDSKAFVRAVRNFESASK